MKNGDTIFRKACLIQLSTSVWQGTRMLESSVMEQIGENSDWLRGRKFLINPELLGPLRTSSHQARNVILRHALPFPITSIYLVPKDSLTAIDSQLEATRETFWRKVGEFAENYSEAREEARKVLGDLFHEADYPEDIRRKFRFEWRFLTLDLPGKTSVLPPELYEREKEKFRAMMDEARDMAVGALREEFGGIVHHLVDRLSGNGTSPKVLSASMFNRMREFLEDFETKNVFEDERLKELVEQAKAVIGGVNPLGLRYKAGLQERIREDMGVLRDLVDEAIEELPRRKIRMAV